jgi:hypothetical protein
MYEQNLLVFRVQKQSVHIKEASSDRGKARLKSEN